MSNCNTFNCISRSITGCLFTSADASPLLAKGRQKTIRGPHSSQGQNIHENVPCPTSIQDRSTRSCTTIEVVDVYIWIWEDQVVLIRAFQFQTRVLGEAAFYPIQDKPKQHPPPFHASYVLNNIYTIHIHIRHQALYPPSCYPKSHTP